MFFDFEFDKAHDRKNPPVGIVAGTVSADPSSFEVRIVFIASGNIFAGPQIITLHEAGTHEVRLSIAPQISPATGTAFVLEQHRLVGESGWRDGTPRMIHYRLASGGAS